MPFTKLSILIPVYNERYYVEQLIDQVIASPLPPGTERELVIVDDCSTDGTREILDRIAESRPDIVRLHAHAKNQGKGAAIRTAIEQASGDLCIIQDADLEYDPRDYEQLLRPLLSGDADVVYGSRFLSSDYRRVHAYWHAFGNRVLTTASNLFTDLTLTDMETCYKVAKSSILKSIPLRSDRFGMEPELTAKFAKRGCRIYEVPISYRGRTYDEGKKIKWIDGFKAIWTIFYFRLVDDIYKDEYGPAAHGLSRTHRTHAWMAGVIKPWVGESVLEIGAGLGVTTLKLLPRRSYVVSDGDPLNLDYLSSRFGNYTWLEVRKIDLSAPDDFTGLEERFDTVVCMSALEHVEHDGDALRGLFGTLKTGGVAIIMVPRGQWLYGPLDRVLGHHRRYSKRELCEKCEAAGFEVDRLLSFNRAGLIPWLVNGKLLRRRRVNKMQLKLFDSLVWLWRMLDRALPMPGLSIIAIARKPQNP